VGFAPTTSVHLGKAHNGTIVESVELPWSECSAPPSRHTASFGSRPRKPRTNASIRMHRHCWTHQTRRRPRSAVSASILIGMGCSNIISLFIIITAAATLNAHGITNIQTSAQAAEALRPIAGVFTFALFAAGIIGIGLLAIPVLAGSCAYALDEALDWSTGLVRLPLDARAFYGTIIVATLIGVAINFVGLDPFKALFWAAVINGVVSVPLMAVIMVMGQFTLSAGLSVMGWLCTGVMAVAVGIMFATW
jgi:Mn2+/Fe2+ NRAMP family transporter